MSKSGQLFEESMDLISASSVGDYGVVDHILKNQLDDVNKVNVSGWTALMYAANYGHYNIIRLLLRHNASVDQRDWQGRTALMLAATNGHTRSIDVLVNHGKADKSLRDLSGINAYQYAKNCGHGNNKLIKSILLNSGGHELKGRSISNRPEPQTQVIPENHRSVNGDEGLNTYKDMYNPYETTVFSSSLWKPIKSKVFSDFGGIGSNESLSSNVYSSSPPDYGNTSEGSALSSSQSSHSSVISFPPNSKRKAIKKKPSVTPMSSPIEKTLFHLLTRIDLIQYLDLLESNGIDFYQFLTLTDDDFQKLGITNYGHRKKLTIAQLRYHESLDINCTHESFLADFLLNERLSLNHKIQELQQKLKSLNETEDK